MVEQAKAQNSQDVLPRRQKVRREVRPLTTDERASFIILSLYMMTFCIITFVYWESLVLKIIGATSASAGLFLFVAAFFNTEAPEKSNSIHPLRSYLVSFFLVLLTLFLLRFIGGMITSLAAALVFLYGGLLIALIAFRKAMIQVISAMLAIIFLFVTFYNLNDILSRRMGFKDALRQCGDVVFKIGPIQDLTNLLLAGPYITYLNRIDYRNEQINLLATKLVAKSNDDELVKATILLNFVSNDINYVSDPKDGIEHAKKPIDTLVAGAGDCEDQALLLCSLLESVGVRTYMAFTSDHVFALIRFDHKYPQLAQIAPHAYIDGVPCYAIDAADPGAWIGRSTATPIQIERVFDVQTKLPVVFAIKPPVI